MISGLSEPIWRLLFVLAIAVSPVVTANDTAPSIGFNRDVRPILSENCFKCHGPDQAQRKANLRLDNEEDAFAELETGSRAIVRGDISKSELIHRIMSSDDEERMPPPESGRTLTSLQKDVLVRWIKQGAPWQKHWSLIRPQRAPLPIVK